MRDQPGLTDLLPAAYPPAFLTDYDQRIGAAETVVRSSVAIAQRQVVTQRITDLLKALPLLLDYLEARLRRATPLTVPANRFGIEPARRARNNGNHEALTSALTTLLQNIAANAKPLADQGQKAAENAQIQELHDNIVADSTTQDASMSSQKLLTEDTFTTLNALYAEMSHLLADGESLYKRTDKTRAKDYTLAQLLKRVRKEQATAAGGSNPA